MVAAAASADMQSEAFKRLYPEEFYARFIAEGVRPDGRPLGRPRPVSVGLGSITTADASAHVKIGNVTALACIKLESMQPSEAAPDAGQVVTTVELTPMCSPHTRPGRPSPIAQVLSEQVGSIVARLVDATQLCITAGKAAWLAYLDIYILDADGSLLDAALLAAVAALRCLALPAVAVNEEGTIVPSPEADSTGSAAPDPLRHPRSLTLACMPVSLTCGFHGASLIVDPSASEEPLLGSTVAAILDEAGDLLGMQKLGGQPLSSVAQLQDCIAHTRLRHKEVSHILQQQLDRAEAARELAPDKGTSMET